MMQRLIPRQLRGFVRMGGSRIQGTLIWSNVSICLHIVNNTWFFNKCHNYLACTDTPSWNDGISQSTCENYRITICRDNSAGTLAGASFNFPEKNCCGCGKTNGILDV